MTEYPPRSPNSESPTNPGLSGETNPNYLTFDTIPNRLTLLRIAFIPLVIGFLFMGDPDFDLAAAIVFGVASITDFLDGYLARQQKLVTIYGKLMDPLADKFLVVSALIMLQHIDRIHPVIVMVLICRELAITGLRALAGAEGIVIAASVTAKFKTATQMFAIPFLMVMPGRWGIPFYNIGHFLILVSLGISLFSGFEYVAGFFKALKERRRQRKLKKMEAKAAKNHPPTEPPSGPKGSR